MNTKTGRVVVACCVFSTLAGLGGFLALRTGGVGASQQAIEDVGLFRVGAMLGEERAGFSGLPKLQVFADAADPGWASLQACLTAPGLQEALAGFTPVLIDERADLETEKVLRERDGARVVARGLNGKVLGALPAGFTCADLLDLLIEIQANTLQSPEKSPIYARLLETTEPIDVLVSQGQAERAAKFVEFLAEFEGAQSPAVMAAEARLPR
jgi:hypothetical protein